MGEESVLIIGRFETFEYNIWIGGSASGGISGFNKTRIVPGEALRHAVKCINNGDFVILAGAVKDEKQYLLMEKFLGGREIELSPALYTGINYNPWGLLDFISENIYRIDRIVLVDETGGFFTEKLKEYVDKLCRKCGRRFELACGR